MGSGARPDCGSTASAALGRFLGRLRIGLGFILAFAGGWILFLAFLGAHGTACAAASAAACGRLLHLAGAPGARCGPASAAARGVRTGHADAAGADQAGNAESGEQFLQIRAFHAPLLVRMMDAQGGGCAWPSPAARYSYSVYRPPRCVSTESIFVIIFL